VADPVTKAALGPRPRFSLMLGQIRRKACSLVPPVHQNRFLSLRQFFPETWAGPEPAIYVSGAQPMGTAHSQPVVLKRPPGAPLGPRALRGRFPQPEDRRRFAN